MARISLLASILLAGVLCDRTCADLGVGDEAPALRVDTWVKGAAVPRFERGRVYVVEFWATWCGPCIAGIPHLTDLQEEFAEDVTIIGVSTKDARGNDLNAVRRLVGAQGSRMDYTIAYCDSSATWSAWMGAAGRSGIPCAFIVDAEGRIAWIGHPARLDGPLADAVEGASGRRAAPEAPLDEAESREAIAIKDRIARSIEDEDRAATIGHMSRLVRLDEIRYAGWAVRRMEVMLEHNERAAISQLRQQLRRTYRDHPGQAAWLVAGVLRSEWSTERVLEMARPEAERLAQVESPDPRLDLLRAEMAIQAGDAEEAARRLEEAGASLDEARLYKENRVQLRNEIASRIESLTPGAAQGGG